MDEEKRFVEHIKYMSDIGYGYTKSNIQYMAADFARSVGKEIKSEDSLSDHWFYGLLSRWPDLKMVKPQKLQLCRAKSASKEVIEKYFQDLGTVMNNVDETGVNTEHSPPKIVCGTESKPQAITSARSANVTIIAGANAAGNYIPPFYVFPGKRWMDELLEGAPAGSAGMMSETGWSNSRIFESYVMDHLSKHAALTEGNKKATLILYDGHKSHLSLTLTEWAKKRNVILFVLPPHTSHLTQPLDISVFGPLKSQYYKECQSYLQKNPGLSISRYEITHLTAKPYLKAFCPENIIGGFRQSGIYPYNRKVISDTQMAPATIYPKDKDPVDTPTCVVESTVNSSEPQEDVEERVTVSLEANLPTDVFVSQPSKPSTSTSAAADIVENFFSARKITKVVQRPKKKFVPPFSVTGNLMKKSNIDTLTSQAQKKAQNNKVQSNPAKKVKKLKTKQEKSKTGTEKNVPKPGTSGLNPKGGPINVHTPEDSSESSNESIADEDKCCSCKLFHPKELKGCDQLIFVKWGQCDFCPHWTHLQYCSEVRVIRRDTIFRCPHFHCTDKN